MNKPAERRAVITPVLWAGICLSWFSPSSHAGYVLTQSIYDCPDVRAYVEQSSGHSTSQRFRDVAYFPNFPSSVQVLDIYDVFAETELGPLTAATCRYNRVYVLNNDTTSPSSGQTSSSPSDLQSVLNRAYGQIRSWLQPSSPPPREERPPRAHPGGVRGKLTGFELVEHSPDYAVFDAITGPALEGEPLLIPFIVDQAGEGDWLSMSVDGVEFFRRLLTDFMIGEMYFAEVPPELIGAVRDDRDLWGYSLESSGSADSQIFFPTELTPVPIPAAAFLFASALGALGWLRRKAA